MQYPAEIMALKIHPNNSGWPAVLVTLNNRTNQFYMGRYQAMAHGLRTIVEAWSRRASECCSECKCSPIFQSVM